jgi:hypothetical protein
LRNSNGEDVVSSFLGMVGGAVKTVASGELFCMWWSDIMNSSFYTKEYFFFTIRMFAK